ncbi:MAG: hypothetical protein V4490_06700, partial [Pseudomonadota bacterium]
STQANDPTFDSVVVPTAASGADLDAVAIGVEESHHLLPGHKSEELVSRVSPLMPSSSEDARHRMEPVKTSNQPVQKLNLAPEHGPTSTESTTKPISG